MGVTTEFSFRIYSDEDGSHIYVGPDGDGLELVELRYVEPNGKMVERLSMTAEQAREVAAAITRYIELTSK